MSKLVHKMIHNELGLKALSVQYVASAAHDVIIQCSQLDRCYTKISWNIFTRCLALHTLGHQYYYAPWFSRDTIQRFSARQDSMRVLKFVPSCLDVVLYVWSHLASSWAYVSCSQRVSVLVSKFACFKSSVLTYGSATGTWHCILQCILLHADSIYQCLAFLLQAIKNLPNLVKISKRYFSVIGCLCNKLFALQSHQR